MKLSVESIANLEKVLATCGIAGIDAIVIEEDSLRGVNEDKTCVIIANQPHPGVPKIKEGYKMGLSRLGVLSNRLSLFKADPQTTVDAKENERGEIASLEIASPSAKVQFRCTASALIKAPKRVNDNVKHNVTVQKEQIPFILSGAKSMSAKRVVIASKNDGLFFEFTDTNQDTFSVKVAESAGEVFAHHFPADVFLPLIRAAVNNNADDETISIEIGEVGTINIVVNGFTLTVLPQVQE